MRSEDWDKKEKNDINPSNKKLGIVLFCSSLTFAAIYLSYLTGEVMAKNQCSSWWCVP